MMHVRTTTTFAVTLRIDPEDVVLRFTNQEQGEERNHFDIPLDIPPLKIKALLLDLVKKIIKTEQASIDACKPRLEDLQEALDDEDEE